MGRHVILTIVDNQHGIMLLEVRSRHPGSPTAVECPSSNGLARPEDGGIYSKANGFHNTAQHVILTVVRNQHDIMLLEVG